MCVAKMCNDDMYSDEMFQNLVRIETYEMCEDGYVDTELETESGDIYRVRFPAHWAPAAIHTTLTRISGLSSIEKGFK